MIRNRTTWPLIAAVALMGCGPEERPLGTGASGKLSTTLPKEDVGAHLVNRLDDAQQKRFDWLHQPFEKVVHFGPAKPAAERVKTLRRRWDAVRFAEVTENKRYRYFATLTTSVGSATIGLADDYCPNHVRAFILLAELGAFDGVALTLKDGLAFVETDKTPTEFTLAAEHYPGFHPNPGAVGNAIVNGQTSPNALALIVDELPVETGGKFNHFGGISDRSSLKVIPIIRENLKKKNGSVRIERTAISRQAGPLFVGEDVALPRLTEAGKPSPEKDRDAASQDLSPPGR